MSDPSRQDLRQQGAGWTALGFARTMPGESACGDALALFPEEDGLTLLVVDGLGHGERAHEASTAAVETTTRLFAERPGASLETVMRACHKGLSGTRGAAVGLLRLSLSAGTLRFCGVGNIALVAHPSRRGLGVSLAGVVGYRMRKVKEFVCEAAPGDLVALYSDGVSSRLSLRGLASRSLEALVDHVQTDWTKDHDDATFIALKLGEPAATADDRET